MRENSKNSVTLYRCKIVQEKTGLVRSAIYKLMADDDFPKPIKITAKAVAWPSNEIDKWILSRIEAGQGSDRGQNFVAAPIDDKFQLTHGERKRLYREPALKGQTKK